MKWFSALNEASSYIQDNKSTSIIVKNISDPLEILLLVFLCSTFFIGVILRIASLVCVMINKKTHKEVVMDFFRFVEKIKLEKEYKDKLMYLLEQADKEKELIDYFKDKLCDIKFLNPPSKHTLKKDIDRFYERFYKPN